MTEKLPDTLKTGIDRRALLNLGAATGAGYAVLAASPPARARATDPKTVHTAALKSDSALDQTETLQHAIDHAASTGVPLRLPPGQFSIGTLQLRTGSRVIGAHGLTTLNFNSRGECFIAQDAHGAALDDLTVDGGHSAASIIAASGCKDLQLSNIATANATGDGVRIDKCSGGITGCSFSGHTGAGIFANDSTGLEICHNTVRDCGNNGIVVFRSQAGEDKTIISHNRIANIAARNGGSGQNGNAINIFRADGVIVSHNQISDCAYSAVRGNAASDIQIVANNCQRIGEVALYAEFGFQGAVILGNLVDTAASGISVTNFNEGGRLAVVQANLIRNLFRREHEPEDKRGTGVSVEADATVTGNCIEAAPTVALSIGWGRYMRNIAATGNVIRDATVGILISADSAAGSCLVANNMISQTPDGAIRAMDGQGRPFGPDLAHEKTKSARVSISGNMSV